MIHCTVAAHSAGQGAQKSSRRLIHGRAFGAGRYLAIIDPKTGLPVPETYIASRFTDDRIKARRTHYEDWIAAIVFNHLFSGADAYVAANLWDFKANIGVVATARSAGVYATLRLR